MVKSPEMGAGTMMSWSWGNLFSFFMVLSVFSLASIELDIRWSSITSCCSFRIRLVIGSRPLSTAVSFIASLILPKPVFWCVYPLILLISSYPYITARILRHALRALQSVIPEEVVYDIRITGPTAPLAVEEAQAMNEPEPEEEGTSETLDLERQYVISGLIVCVSIS